jgi:hypothetical protein
LGFPQNLIGSPLIDNTDTMKTRTADWLILVVVYLTGFAIVFMIESMPHPVQTILLARIDKGISILLLAGFIYGAWKLYSSLRGK